MNQLGYRHVKLGDRQPNDAPRAAASHSRPCLFAMCVSCRIQMSRLGHFKHKTLDLQFRTVQIGILVTLLRWVNPGQILLGLERQGGSMVWVTWDGE